MKKIGVLLTSIFLLSCSNGIDYNSFATYDIVEDLWLPLDTVSHNMIIDDTVSMYSVLLFLSSTSRSVKNINIAVSIGSDKMSKQQKDTFNIKFDDEMKLTHIARERKGFFVVMDSIKFKSSGTYSFLFNPLDSTSISSLGVLLKKENNG